MNVLIEPRLVDAEIRIREQAVAIEALDVVALERAAVAPDVDVVLLHRDDEHRAGDRAPERRGVEVGHAGGGDVERAALQRGKPFGDQLRAAVDQPRLLGAVLQRLARDLVVVGLVGLAEVRGVGVRDRALLRASSAAPRSCRGRRKTRCRLSGQSEVSLGCWPSLGFRRRGRRGFQLVDESKLWDVGALTSRLVERDAQRHLPGRRNQNIREQQISRRADPVRRHEVGTVPFRRAVDGRGRERLFGRRTVGGEQPRMSRPVGQRERGMAGSDRLKSTTGLSRSRPARAGACVRRRSARRRRGHCRFHRPTIGTPLHPAAKSAASAAEAAAILAHRILRRLERGLCQIAADLTVERPGAREINLRGGLRRPHQATGDDRAREYARLSSTSLRRARALPCSDPRS